MTRQDGQERDDDLLEAAGVRTPKSKRRFRQGLALGLGIGGATTVAVAVIALIGFVAIVQFVFGASCDVLEALAH